MSAASTVQELVWPVQRSDSIGSTFGISNLFIETPTTHNISPTGVATPPVTGSKPTSPSPTSGLSGGRFSTKPSALPKSFMEAANHQLPPPYVGSMLANISQPPSSATLPPASATLLDPSSPLSTPTSPHHNIDEYINAHNASMLEQEAQAQALPSSTLPTKRPSLFSTDWVGSTDTSGSFEQHNLLPAGKSDIFADLLQDTPTLDDQALADFVATYGGAGLDNSSLMRQ